MTLGKFRNFVVVSFSFQNPERPIRRTPTYRAATAVEIQLLKQFGNDWLVEAETGGNGKPGFRWQGTQQLRHFFDSPEGQHDPSVPVVSEEILLDIMASLRAPMNR